MHDFVKDTDGHQPIKPRPKTFRERVKSARHPSVCNTRSKSSLAWPPNLGCFLWSHGPFHFATSSLSEGHRWLLKRCTTYSLWQHGSQRRGARSRSSEQFIAVQRHYWRPKWRRYDREQLHRCRLNRIALCYGSIHDTVFCAPFF
jgi:hypothetical protein